jgi:hypothetical protein
MFSDHIVPRQEVVADVAPETSDPYTAANDLIATEEREAAPVQSEAAPSSLPTAPPIELDPPEGVGQYASTGASARFDPLAAKDKQEPSAEATNGTSTRNDEAPGEEAALEAGGAGGAERPPDPPQGGSGFDGESEDNDRPGDDDTSVEGGGVEHESPEDRARLESIAELGNDFEAFKRRYSGRVPEEVDEIPQEQTVTELRDTIRELASAGSVVYDKSPEDPQKTARRVAFGTDEELPAPTVTLFSSEPAPAEPEWGRVPASEQISISSAAQGGWSIEYTTSEGAPTKTVRRGAPAVVESTQTPTDTETRELTELVRRVFNLASPEEFNLGSAPADVPAITDIPRVEKRLEVIERPTADLERIDRVAGVLGRAVEVAVVVDADAVDATLGETTAQSPQTTQVFATQEAFNSLWEQGWEVSRAADGTPIVTRDGVVVQANWGTVPMEGAQERAWRTPERGVPVAHLMDVYANALDSGTEAGRELATRVRERLQDPTKPPLPDHVMWRELAEARESMPEHLRDRWDARAAAKVAAHANFLVRATCGDARTGRVNQIVGNLELVEYNVPATYHDASKHTPETIHELHEAFDFMNAQDIAAGRPPTFTEEDYIDVVVAEYGSDAIYGGGRRRDRPADHDELRSAQLAKAHLLDAGYPQPRAMRVGRVIYNTTFDEITGTQTGTYHFDPLVRLLTGSDLQTLSSSLGLKNLGDLTIEDLHSARDPISDRILGKVAFVAGVRIISTIQGKQFIDEYRDAKSPDAPGGPSLIQALSNRYQRGVNFFTGYRYPIDYPLAHQGVREDNAAKAAEIAERLVTSDPTRHITAVQSSEMELQHAHDMRVKWGVQ